MSNFWSGLPHPFFALAPMEDVTDAAFRSLIARTGKPDVFFTEFTSADGLVLAPEGGRQKLLKKLQYDAIEHPIVAQLFSASPERMEKAAALVAELAFDGVDINMGCPDRAIEKSLCGAAMIKDPLLAREIIRAAKRGAGDIPVSVKTRIGYATNEIPTWIRALLEENIAALTIHARTRNELSDVPARWEHVREVAELRDTLGVETVIIGNGDVRDLNDAREKAAAYGADGVMLGRAIFGNPWLFAEHVPSKEERIEKLIEHIRLFDELLGGTTNYATMKKHFKAYIHGWHGASELRARLMETDSPDETIGVLDHYASMNPVPSCILPA